MKKRIIFDLDNTLIDWNEKYWNAVNKAFDKLGVQYSDSEIEKVKKSVDIYEDGRNSTYNKEEMQETIEKELGYKLPSNFANEWLEHLGTCVPDKIDIEEIKTLEYLDKKYDLVVLTNWFRDSQVERLKNANIIKYFTEIYATEDTIPMKPAKEAFEVACGEYKKEECVMVGDNLITDIKGAINAGIDAIYLNKNYTSNDVKSAEYETISKIQDLKQIL